MKPACQEIPVEKLIAYCDGELPPDEAKRVEEHVNNCLSCRTMSEALRDSLKVVQGIWQNDEAKWGELRSFKKLKLRRWPVKSIASAAAGIILVCSVGLMWLLSEQSEQKHVVGRSPTIAEIEMEAERAAIAAQMLAAGDMYAARPGEEKYAVQRYNELIESFSSSPESKLAKIRLKELSERMVQ